MTYHNRLFNDEGKTYAFDNRATSGFARGEGAGVVLLKSLDDAIRDKDPIRAVIVNSGVSQDGRTQGITLPNGHAQEELIRRVYNEAHIDPEDCGFVEMHGTGTKVGDPIEATAVHAALGHGRSPRNPLYIGSVKSNVGHLEGASGVISLIKAAMMLDRDLLLPNADFKKANENIPLNEWNMKVSYLQESNIKNITRNANQLDAGCNIHQALATRQEIHQCLKLRLRRHKCACRAGEGTIEFKFARQLFHRYRRHDV